MVEDVEAALLAHPGVARLDGSVASYLPGRRVVGVRVVGGRVEVAVVLRPPSRPIREVVSELRAVVTSVAGPSSVDVVVADLAEP